MPGSIRRGCPVAGINRRPKLLCHPCGERRYNDVRMSLQLRRDRMKKRLMLAGFALALGAGYTLTAFSQVKPETMVKQRQAAMTLQGKYAGPLGAMAAGKAPYNADTVAFNAAMLDALSRMPWDGFAESTKGVSVKTAALPTI